MHSRYEIGLKHYALSVGLEARLTFEVGTTSVLPAAVRHQTEVALNLGAPLALAPCVRLLTRAVSPRL